MFPHINDIINPKQLRNAIIRFMIANKFFNFRRSVSDVFRSFIDLSAIHYAI